MDCPDAIMGPGESETGSRDGGSKEDENLANAEKETSSFEDSCSSWRSHFQVSRGCQREQWHEYWGSGELGSWGPSVVSCTTTSSVWPTSWSSNRRVTQTAAPWTTGLRLCLSSRRGRTSSSSAGNAEAVVELSFYPILSTCLMTITAHRWSPLTLSCLSFCLSLVCVRPRLCPTLLTSHRRALCQVPLPWTTLTLTRCAGVSAQLSSGLRPSPLSPSHQPPDTLRSSPLDHSWRAQSLWPRH